jgi:hypothetical protein
VDAKGGRETKGSQSTESRRPAEPAAAAPAEPGVDPALARALIDRVRKRDRSFFFLLSVIAIGSLLSAATFGLLLYLNWESIRLNREAVDVARQGTQRQLRAYVSAEDFKCGGCGDNAGADEVFVKIANAGRTPAFNVYARIGWSADARCGTAGSGFTYTYAQARYFQSFRTLAKDVRDTTTFDLNRDAVQQARTSNTRLCVYGTVNYATAFSDLGERETRFCYWYSRGSQRAACEDQNDQN